MRIFSYDDIRQLDGFKNVSLGNVLRAQAPNEEITFLRSDDKQLFEKYRGQSFEVQVGIHELLGHGSGKLCEQFADGSANFDLSKPPISPITNRPIVTWYKNGETWGSKFGSMAASYEECRAESVGIYLSTDPEILKIFGHSGQEAEDVLYVNWLLMARAGLLALEFYDPKTNKWGQAHMQARYAILQVMLR
jgi:dipeptidyl-peptidase-3